MTTTTVTLIGDVSDLIGNDYDPSRTKVWVQHNTDKVVTDSGPIRLGAATKAVASDGTFSFANVVASTSLVENLQTTLWVDWPNTAGPERTRRRMPFGPYDLTGLSGTVDIRTLEATQALDPVASSALLSEMQDLRDEQVAISGIDSTDTAVAYAVQHGATTPGVLSASIVDETRPANAINPITGMIHADAFGAKGDLRQVRDAVTTSGSKIITSPTAGFTSAHVGKAVSIYPEPPGPAVVTSTIASVQSATQITLSDNAGSTQTGARLTWGTDNTTFLQAWLDAGHSSCHYYLPIGAYGTVGPVYKHDGSFWTISGANQGMRAPQFGYQPGGSQIITFNDNPVLVVDSTATSMVTRPSGNVIEDIGVGSAPAGYASIGLLVSYSASGGGAQDTLTVRGFTAQNVGTGYKQQYADSTLITGSWISENYVCNIYSENSIYLRVDDVVIADGGDNIILANDYGPRITHNIISHGQYGIHAVGVTALKAEDNQFLGQHKQVIYLESGCSLCKVADNTSAIADKEFALLDSAFDCVIENNLIYASSQAGDMAYDVIRVTNNSSRNVVQNNTPRMALRSVSGMAPNVGLTANPVVKARYAVNVEGAGCIANRVAFNDLLAAAVQAGVKDTGTATDKTGNREGGALWDTFTRTSTTSAGTPDNGVAWEAVTGVWGTNGTQLYVATPAAGVNQLRNKVLTVADGVFGVTIAVPDNKDGGLYLRRTDDNNQFAVLASGTVYKVQAGSASVAASFTAAVAGTQMVVAMSGSSFRLYRDGVLATTWTSTFNVASGDHGIRTYAGSALGFDNAFAY